MAQQICLTFVCVIVCGCLALDDHVVKLQDDLEEVFEVDNLMKTKQLEELGLNNLPIEIASVFRIWGIDPNQELKHSQDGARTHIPWTEKGVKMLQVVDHLLLSFWDSLTTRFADRSVDMQALAHSMLVAGLYYDQTIQETTVQGITEYATKLSTGRIHENIEYKLDPVRAATLPQEQDVGEHESATSQLSILRQLTMKLAGLVIRYQEATVKSQQALGLYEAAKAKATDSLVPVAIITEMETAETARKQEAHWIHLKATDIAVKLTSLGVEWNTFWSAVQVVCPEVPAHLHQRQVDDDRYY
jgi:hypothetical protein